MFSQAMLALGQKCSVIREIFEYGNLRKKEIGPENVFDFSIGNPSVPPPQALTDALMDLIQNTDPAALHAYTSAPGDADVREAVAKDLRERFHARARGDLIYMTAGAAASLTITLSALCVPGDEVIVLTPFFTEYSVFVAQAGAKLVCVPAAEVTFQVDGDRLAAAVNAHTKAVIINTPNNPTGAVLTEESLRTLADVLKAGMEKYGHPIYLISDEPYRELVYGGVKAPFAANYYENTVICYSFSKSLSLPGERIGYIAVSPEAEDCENLFLAVCGAGRSLGFVCAPALFQRAVARCLGQTGDLSVYDRNRTLLYDAVTEYGFRAVKPDGAFYLFMQSPERDANTFCERAKKQELLFVPGDDFGGPGWVRIAYCVGTDMIRRSLPAFRKLAETYNL